MNCWQLSFLCSHAGTSIHIFLVYMRIWHSGSTGLSVKNIPLVADTSTIKRPKISWRLCTYETYGYCFMYGGLVWKKYSHRRYVSCHNRESLILVFALLEISYIMLLHSDPKWYWDSPRFDGRKCGWPRHHARVGPHAITCTWWRGVANHGTWHQTVVNFHSTMVI